VAILHLHFYLPVSTKPPYDVDKFVTYLRGSVDPTTPEQASEPPSDRFDSAGVPLDFKKKALTGTEDFKKSLLDPDSVVVYLGHSVLDFKNKRSLGLSPMGHDSADIAPDALMDLLKASKAKLVILATCASSTLGLKNLKVGPAVVVTNSGSDLKTWSNDWGLALKYFLLALIGYTIAEHDKPFSLETRANLFSDIVGAGVTGAVASKLVGRRARATIREALKASDLGFKENNSTDRFQLAHGEGSKVVFPDKE
jgi:hypothetical protein